MQNSLVGLISALKMKGPFIICVIFPFVLWVPPIRDFNYESHQ